MRLGPTILLALSASLLSPAGNGEGAVKTLDCEIPRTCDSAGVCADDSGRIDFRLEPIELEAGGVGRYTIRYGDAVAEADARSDIGPFAWTVGQARHALVISSDTQWIWHRLEPDSTAAIVHFMRCDFQQ